ncbi:putative head morphogenesis protein [Pseudomonas phage MR14]|nr:putative head morphogenesis protein [Pseudomonas phage MR14]
MPSPILPSNLADPTGQDRRERAVIAEFSRRLRTVRQAYVAVLDRIPRQTVTVNAETTQYTITPELLAGLLTEVALQVDRILLQNEVGQLWFIEAGVVPAYQAGAAQQFTNLSVQSATYAASRQNLTALITSQPYQTRLGFLKLRVEDSLRGYSAGVQAQMSQVLQDGLVTGRNPRDIAKLLADQTGVAYRKAETIARTEVPGALRAARLQEADAARSELGIKTLECHLSALSPTTRKTHRDRHATLHTTQDQRDWWSRDGNFANCKCSTVSVLVDDKGQPLTPGVISRAKAMLEKNPAPSQ